MFPSDHIIYGYEYQKSHSYSDKVVLVIDNELQGHAIVSEVALVAKEVIVISKQAYKGDNDLPDNIQHFSHVTKIASNQMVHFSDGTSKKVDIIILCNYKYVFPYLHDSYGFNIANEQKANPLYKSTFNPRYPSMAFVGTVVSSTLAYCDMQVMWALRVWLGQQPLPCTAEMLTDCKNGMDFSGNNLAVLYKELASYSETQPPSAALIGIFKQIGSQAAKEERLKNYTVLSSEHWIVTNN